MENKTFSVNDLYVITYYDRNENGVLDEYPVIVIGEESANALFDSAKEHHDITVMYKGKVFKCFNSIVEDEEIRRYEK